MRHPREAHNRSDSNRSPNVGSRKISGRAVLWFPKERELPFSMNIIPPKGERVLHSRKYAEGNMRDNSFYFRDPDNRQNLKAQITNPTHSGVIESRPT